MGISCFLSQDREDRRMARLSYAIIVWRDEVIAAVTFLGTSAGYRLERSS
jgi:hypothetical protein